MYNILDVLNFFLVQNMIIVIIFNQILVNSEVFNMKGKKTILLINLIIPS